MDSVTIKGFRVKKTNPRWKYFHAFYSAIGFKTNLIPVTGEKHEIFQAAFENHWKFETLKQARMHADDVLVDVAGILIKDEPVQFISAINAT